ncbi:MAG: HNH endonuclease [Planctomycetales bacterium]|jgi:hypothetical protein
MTDAFVYSQRRVRRHGPAGYKDYPSYRRWLRDEFTFRCVYCLIREEWGRLTGEFDLDHFQPQANRPDLTTEYENLVYACHTCNLRKSDHDTFDPETSLTKELVRVYPSGRVDGVNPHAKAIIAKLGLDSPKFRKWRLIWIRNVELAKQHDRDHYRRLLGFPEDLPDLSILEPVSNSIPDGVNESYYAVRSRGELPEYYVE